MAKQIPGISILSDERAAGQRATFHVISAGRDGRKRIDASFAPTATAAGTDTVAFYRILGESCTVVRVVPTVGDIVPRG